LLVSVRLLTLASDTSVPMFNRLLTVRYLSGSAVLGASMIGLVFCALPAHATIVWNGSFEDVGTATSSFSISNPTILPGWSATPAGNQVLDCLVFSGATSPLCSGNVHGWTLAFWVDPGPSPDGGNYVAVDGDQNYSTPLTQTLTGLVPGTVYDVTFYQAAAQQQGFNGATTDQWEVELGGDSQFSTIMDDANHGAVGWMSQSMTFTAQLSSELLSFIAVGTPNGEPPFALLDGVSVTADAPEPGTSALIGIGLLSIPIVHKLLKKRGNRSGG